MAFTFAGRYGPEAFWKTDRSPLADTPVTIRLPGEQTLATLYTARDKATAAANPVNTDSFGNLMFWADPGEYDLEVQGVTFRIVVPLDPTEAAQDLDLDALLPKIAAVRMGSKSGRYYPAGGYAGSGTSTLVANRMFLLPIIVAKPIVVETLDIDVATVSAGDIRLGIYESDDDGFPGSLVVDAGTVPGTPLGVKVLTVNQALAVGTYWVACVASVQTAVRGVSSVSSVGFLISIPANLGTLIPTVNIADVPGSSDALPVMIDPAVITGTTIAPRMLVKVA